MNYFNKIIIFLLIAIIVFFHFFLLLYFFHISHSIKKTLTKFINHDFLINEHLIERFDINNINQNAIWIEYLKEFKLNEKMYDVIKVEENYIFAINDTKEEYMLKIFDSIHQRDKKVKILNDLYSINWFFVTRYFQFINNNFNFIYIPFKTTIPIIYLGKAFPPPKVLPLF